MSAGEGIQRQACAYQRKRDLAKESIERVSAKIDAIFAAATHPKEPR